MSHNGYRSVILNDEGTEVWASCRCKTAAEARHEAKYALPGLWGNDLKRSRVVVYRLTRASAALTAARARVRPRPPGKKGRSR